MLLLQNQQLFSSSKKVVDDTLEDLPSISELSTAAIITIVASLVVIGIAILLLVIVKRVFKKYLKPNYEGILKEKRTIMRIIYSILRFSIILFAILLVLSIFGVNISGAFAACGIAAASGALAVQDLLKDLIQGVNIVSDKYFSLGDVIEYEGVRGKVIELTMRSTKVRRLDDNSVVTIGNHFLTLVTVVSHEVNYKIPFGYDVDVVVANAAMQEINKRILDLEAIEESEFRGTQLFDKSSVQYMITYKCDPSVQLQTKRDVNRIVQDVFKEKGLVIPYDHIDVITHSDK